MAGELGLTPILPPPRKQGGSPRFPGGLNQHFAPVTGSYKPPEPITGSYRPPPPTRQEQRAAPVRSAWPGVQSGFKAPTGRPTPPSRPTPPARGGGTWGTQSGISPSGPQGVNRSQSGVYAPSVSQLLKGGVAGIERGERAAARQALQIERAKTGAGPLAVPAFVQNLSGKLAASYGGGAATGLIQAGVPKEIANTTGKVVGEGVSLPTQTLLGTYHAGAAAGAAVGGHPEKLEHLGKEFVQNSAAGKAISHLYNGDFEGAAKGLWEGFKNAPLATGLEASAIGGPGGLLDHLAGTLKKAGAASDDVAARLTDKGEITRPPRNLPPEYGPPGGVTMLHLPYSKAPMKRALQKAFETRKVNQARAKARVRGNVDEFEAEQHAITRQTRDEILGWHNNIRGIGPGNGRRLAGEDALTPFGVGLLADPSKLDEHGFPLYKRQLAEAIDYWSKPAKGETDSTQREALVEHLRKLETSPKFERNAAEVYKRQNLIAAAKRDSEPWLEKLGILHSDTARINKLKYPFQFHFRDQNPWIEPSVPRGESPFRLNGREVSVDEVAKKLADKGINENQLSFVSTRPYQTPEQAMRSGRQPGGEKLSTGKLSGQRFLEGRWDPSPDTLARQHLTDAQLINHGLADQEIARRYVHTREDIAKLIESHMGNKPAEQQAALRDYINKELRSGNDRYFTPSGQGRSAWDRAKEAAERLKEAGVPNIQPMRVGHQFASKQYREALGRHLNWAEEADRMDPENFDPSGFWQTKFPKDDISRKDPSAGPVGLVHSDAANRLMAYDKNLGSTHALQMPSNWWRRVNVAYSPRHLIGVSAEMAARALMAEVGPLSLLRGHKANEYLEEFAKNHPDPQVQLGFKRIQAWARGSVAQQAAMQTKKVPLAQLQGTPFETPVGWWLKGEAHKLTGFPLRAVRGAVTAFSHVTNKILELERRGIEHPPQVAGLGKHFEQEYRELTGHRLAVIKSFKGIEKEFLQGRLNPKAIDAFIAAHQNYWGDWMRSSPDFRKAQAAVPFLRWYMNSLKFVYATMPLHHPIKTGMLVAIEQGTKELREKEGQGYKKWLELMPEGSALPFQQGSIPGLGPKGSERIGLEYYNPVGGLSAGLEGLLGAVWPYAVSTIETAKGNDPITGKRLEEEVEGTKRPITEPGKLALKAALNVLEEMFPPARLAKQAAEPVEPEKELAGGRDLAKMLGINPAVLAGPYKAFRPIKEEKAYYTGGKYALPPGLAKELEEHGGGKPLKAGKPLRPGKALKAGKELKGARQNGQRLR